MGLRFKVDYFRPLLGFKELVELKQKDLLTKPVYPSKLKIKMLFIQINRQGESQRYERL